MAPCGVELPFGNPSQRDTSRDVFADWQHVNKDQDEAQEEISMLEFTFQ